MSASREDTAAGPWAIVAEPRRERGDDRRPELDEVASQPGEFTEFTIRLPRNGQAAGRSS